MMHLIFGKNTQIPTNNIHATIAAIFNFHSIDFLLQYSFHHAENQPIHNQIHPLGDIIKTQAIKTHHNITKARISNVFIIQQQ